MYEVKAYYLPEESAKKLSANFTVREFACKDGSNIVLISPKLVNILQDIRTKVGKPVLINSAYRTPAWNNSSEVKGSPSSLHQFGCAADIKVGGMTPRSLAKICDGIVGSAGAVLLYPTFVHVDVRGNKKRMETKDGKNFTAVNSF